MKKILKYTAAFLLLLVLAFFAFVIYATIIEFEPHEKIVAYNNPDAVVLSDSTEISLIIWNIGYCGLNAEMDFFYDGGKRVFADTNEVNANIEAVKDFAQNNYADIYLFQEVDVNSKRSYYTNQLQKIHNVLDIYTASFGKNYDVFFVPIPLKSPYGKVLSGIATYSIMPPVVSVRYSYPSKYSWPKRAFMLDRCFLLNRYPVTNGKELIVVNTHNSAYDDGSLRKKEMEYIRNILIEEYKNGNYIIAGGDWNQCPPGFKPDYWHQKLDTVNLSYMRKDIFPTDWSFVYDNSQPTNRRITSVYKKGKSNTTMIDYYIVSPNVEPMEVEIIDLDFQNSDHNPVKATFKLIPEK